VVNFFFAQKSSAIGGSPQAATKEARELSQSGILQCSDAAT
jgi:hypothetical protein